MSKNQAITLPENQPLSSAPAYSAANTSVSFSGIQESRFLPTNDFTNQFEGLKPGAPLLEGVELEGVEGADGIIDFTQNAPVFVYPSVGNFRLAEFKAMGFGMTFDARTDGLTKEQVLEKQQEIINKTNGIEGATGVDAWERICDEITFQRGRNPFPFISPDHVTQQQKALPSNSRLSLGGKK